MKSDQVTPNAENARTALLTKLDQLCRKPVKPPKSLQPTPEAAKSRISRFRKQRRLLLKKRENRAL
jgi:hypothetical protein